MYIRGYTRQHTRKRLTGGSDSREADGQNSTTVRRIRVGQSTKCSLTLELPVGGKKRGNSSLQGSGKRSNDAYFSVGPNSKFTPPRHSKRDVTVSDNNCIPLHVLNMHAQRVTVLGLFVCHSLIWQYRERDGL